MTSAMTRIPILASAIAFAVPQMAAAADTTTYPARPIRMIVPFSPGGTSDTLARILGQRMADNWGQPVVVDSRPGASGIIGTEVAMRAPADGYTMLLVNPANGINASLYKDLSFNFVNDIAPVAGLIRVPNVMEIHPGVPAKTVAEFIAYAKANPGKINMASSGSGTSVHLSGEMFKSMAGIDMVHVPYRGAGPALIDLVAGQVHVIFDNLPSSIEKIRAGQLRALAVTTSERSPALPGVPTVAETVPGYEASAWFGMGAPKGTPAEIIALLNKAINDALAEPAMQAKLADLGGMLMTGTPEQFGAVIRSETEKWSKVVKDSGAKVE